MKPIYITERGDDENDGSSIEKAVHSWKRALQLSKSGSSEFRIPDRVTMERIHAEIAEVKEIQRWHWKLMRAN